MTGKQTPLKTKAEVIERKCSSCDEPDTSTVLLTIILPPVIMERQDPCPPCLAMVIGDSKKRGKAAQ